MASKFQNRLVGTIILVALGVIILPGLLDGKKKHYQDQFAAIPLVPKQGDVEMPDMLLSTNQALPSQPPEGAAEEVRAGSELPPGLDRTIASNATQTDIDTLPDSGENSPGSAVPEKSTTQSVEAVSSSAAKKPVMNHQSPQTQTLDKTQKPMEKPPVGRAYVVQLGALKNAAKVNEIVAKLRAAGFRVYTFPSTPVQDKLTRILVGPDVSKDKLKSSLGRLKALSGLEGVVINYTPH